MKTRNSHGLLQLGREALAYCQCASALISGNKALFVSVDLIGEKNQVILEYQIKTNWLYLSIKCMRFLIYISENHTYWMASDGRQSLCRESGRRQAVRGCPLQIWAFSLCLRRWTPWRLWHASFLARATVSLVFSWYWPKTHCSLEISIF